MHRVLPSTTVRGPAALTMSFITSADSHPWHVRWPEVKYSSRGAFLTPLIGSRTGSGESSVGVCCLVHMALLPYALTPLHCVSEGAFPASAALRDCSIISRTAGPRTSPAPHPSTSLTT